MKMKNNQNNNNKTIYQYNVTANSDINYANVPKMNNNGNGIPKPSIEKQQFDPALKRAQMALKLVNPFKGV